MRSTRKIVLIEDDKELSSLTTGHFMLAGFRVAALEDTGDIRAFRSGKLHSDVELIILDIMLPFSGLYTRKESSNGTHTGLALSLDLRMRYPKVPILFWSGFPLVEIKKMAKLRAEKMGNSGIVAKGPNGIVTLIQVVDHYFRTGRLKRGLVHRILSSLIVRPSVAGVGVDVKELLRK
jgi:hypothetical protein